MKPSKNTTRPSGELTASGLWVATFDWRGQGGSQRLLKNPMPGYVRRFSDYEKDLEQFLEEIVLPDARLPFFCHRSFDRWADCSLGGSPACQPYRATCRDFAFYRLEARQFRPDDPAHRNDARLLDGPWWSGSHRVGDAATSNSHTMCLPPTRHAFAATWPSTTPARISSSAARRSGGFLNH